MRQIWIISVQNWIQIIVYSIKGWDDVMIDYQCHVTVVSAILSKDKRVSWQIKCPVFSKPTHTRQVQFLCTSYCRMCIMWNTYNITYQTSTNSLYIKYRIWIMWDTYNITHTRQVNFSVRQIQNIYNVEYKQCSTHQVNFLFNTIQNLYSVAASNLDHLIPH